MRAKIKICGISTPQMAQYAASLGADFIGVIFFPESPRHISYSTASKIKHAISGNAKLVAVMVNPKNEEIEEMLEHFKPDYIQLHGSETPERAEYIKNHYNIPIIKAVSVSSKQDIKTTKLYNNVADFILFDAKPPKSSNLPGGNAVKFDWNILNNIDLDKKFFLSGGIYPNNINEAINFTSAKYIDLSSGVEESKGKKSKKLIFKLFEEVNKR